MKYKDLFNNKNYIIFVLANSISRIGDSIDALAFSYLVYLLTGKASLTGLMITINYLPSIFLMPFSGVIADKYNKKKIMVITHFLRCLLVVSVLFLYSINRVNIIWLYITTFLVSTVESFCMPASSSIVPFLVNKDEIDTGSSFKSLCNTIGSLIGSGIAGVIIAFIGIQMTLTVDACIFCLCAIFETFIVYKEEKNITESDSFFTLLKQGFSYVKKQSFLIKVMCIAIFLNALCIPTETFSLIIVDKIYHFDTSYVSYTDSAYIIGVLLGSIVTPLVSKKYRFKNMIFPSEFIIGGCVLAFILVPSLNNTIIVFLLGILVRFIYGMTVGILNGCLNIEYIKIIEPSYLARCDAIFSAASTSFIPVASGLSSFLVNYIPLRSLIIGSGILLIICSFVSTYILRNEKNAH